ncbi:MAG: Gfo/Idh/MocA family oxidoreductase [Verrucomicrobiales bacterium]|nr:Gfo/Idh/MocA family oxidoreductase [Verrucomicrobiales bacterium]
MNQTVLTIPERRLPRRRFLQTTSALGGAAVMGSLPLERAVHAAGSGTIRIGLIGCGGRGTAAAINAMNAGPDVTLVAMAELFRERLDESLAGLRAAKPSQTRVTPGRCFLGFDAHRDLLTGEVDAVIIAPTSHFIPAIFQTAVAAGKHVFCEKPHGIDIPGLKLSMAAANAAREKGLNVVSGLCWRYDPGVRATMQQVHEGRIGDILAIQETYVSVPYILRDRRPGQGEMEWQLWNWYHFNWLSGDQTAQQLIHSLDKASWALGDHPPVKAWGMGGRQTCLGPQYGDQFDHQAVVFEYDAGVRVFGFTRDQPACWNNTSDYLMGTKGRCDLLNRRIEGERPWHYDGPRENMYDVEHRELFDAIRNGRPINNGHYMCLSSALAIMAQMACYSGSVVTYEDAMQSERSFALSHYAWDVEPPVKPDATGRYPTAMPGPAEYEQWRMP